MSNSQNSLPLEDQIGTRDGSQLPPEVLDKHGGVIVNMEEPMDADIFLAALRASILRWKHEEKKGVWIKLPIGLANLVEVAVKEGFWYHHAEPKYLMLVYWIPETICTIPPNATHRVGIGAIVLTEKSEVLVVLEKSGKFGQTGKWKIPTGVVEEGEDICAAAVREVKEETGINTEFVEVVAFRQGHKAFFEKSDLFFICFLRPLSFNIQEQDLEIEAAQWMQFEEFAAQPFNQKESLSKYIVDLCLAKIDPTSDYTGFSAELLESSSSNKKPPYLYLNTRDLQKAGPETTNES